MHKRWKRLRFISAQIALGEEAWLMMKIDSGQCKWFISRFHDNIIWSFIWTPNTGFGKVSICQTIVKKNLNILCICYQEAKLSSVLCLVGAWICHFWNSGMIWQFLMVHCYWSMEWDGWEKVAMGGWLLSKDGKCLVQSCATWFSWVLWSHLHMCVKV